MYGYQDVKKSEFVRDAIVLIGTEIKTTRRRTKDEEWKVVEEFPDYVVSSNGRVTRVVKAKNNQKPRYLGFTNLKGYQGVALFKDNKKHIRQIHHLVLEAFISPRPKGHETNHINADRSDNRVENLEWVTSSENRRHSMKLGRAFFPKGEEVGGSKLTNDDVLQIRDIVSRDILLQTEVAKLFNISTSQICAIKQRKEWRHI